MQLVPPTRGGCCRASGRSRRARGNTRRLVLTARFSQAQAASDADAALPVLNAAIVLWQTGHCAESLALAQPLLSLPHGGLPLEAQERLCSLLVEASLESGSATHAAQALAQLERCCGASHGSQAQLWLARARLCLLDGTQKAAWAQLKSSTALAQAGPPLPLVQLQFARAHLERLRAPAKASCLLQAAQALAPQPQPGLAAHFAVAGGAALASSGRHACAAVCYARALRSTDDARAPPAFASPVVALRGAQWDTVQYAHGASSHHRAPCTAAWAHLPISCLSSWHLIKWLGPQSNTAGNAAPPARLARR